jgi:hypothetical protein
VSSTLTLPPGPGFLLGIEQTTETVDKDDGTDVCVGVRREVCSAVCLRQAFPQTLVDAVQEAVQHGVLQFGALCESGSAQYCPGGVCPTEPQRSRKIGAGEAAILVFFVALAVGLTQYLPERNKRPAAFAEATLTAVADEHARKSSYPQIAQISADKSTTKTG